MPADLKLLKAAQPVLLLTGCQVCHGFGKVHLRKADGKVDYGSLVFCRCQGDKARKVASPARTVLNEPEHYVEITTADYDFPMAWSQWRAISIRNGWGDPGPDKPLRQHEESTKTETDGTVTIERRIIEDRVRDPKIGELEGNFKSLRDLLKQHINGSVTRGKKNPKIWD